MCLSFEIEFFTEIEEASVEETLAAAADTNEEKQKQQAQATTERRMTKPLINHHFINQRPASNGANVELEVNDTTSSSRISPSASIAANATAASQLAENFAKTYEASLPLAKSCMSAGFRYIIHYIVISLVNKKTHISKPII